MLIELHDALENALRYEVLPTVIAYNRIDGPGSSLDLREFQQALWTMPRLPHDIKQDISAEWSKGLPRTVGITIDVGTKIEARPLERGLIGVRSVEYGTETIAETGDVPPTKENWLLRVLDIFGLSGVLFVLHNLQPGVQSAGLGGSATAATGVCLLANELAGRPLSLTQLVSMASRIEQDLSVSLTGTQEQSNVVFGGVTDYVWFPWGIPFRQETSYGESLRFELVPPEAYAAIEERMALFHSGRTRSSTDVNSVWIQALYNPTGYKNHKLKLEIAYRFREGLRLSQWDEVVEATKQYQKIRTKLCPSYLNGSREILGFADENKCATFPLGAGGGGIVLIIAENPSDLKALRNELSGIYREIPFKILPKGHKLINLPLEWR